MKWIKLFNKIGKQPLYRTQNNDVLLKDTDGNFYKLKLVFTDNGSKFHLEVDKGSK